MIKYFRKQLINYQFLTIFLIFLFCQLFICFGISRSFVGDESALFARQYLPMYEEKILRFNNYLLIAVVTVLVVISHRKSELPLSVFCGKVKLSIARLFFVLFEILAIFVVSFASMVIFSTIFINYFTTSLSFGINYLKSLINILILMLILQIVIRWDNKIIAPLISGAFIFLSTIITDFQIYIPIYKYVLPINELNIYNNSFGYLYLSFYVILLFLIYLTVKKTEQLKG